MAETNHYYLGHLKRLRFYYGLHHPPSSLADSGTVKRKGAVLLGILDGIVEWIAEQVMNALDLITTSVLGALGCSMDTFLRYFPAAEDMYEIFVALALGLVLLNWIWQLFKTISQVSGWKRKIRSNCLL